MVEYAFLGLLSSVVGIGMAVLAAWIQAVVMFEADFGPSLLPLLGLAALVLGITVLIGLFNSREVLTCPPLKVLRGEG